MKVRGKKCGFYLEIRGKKCNFAAVNRQESQSIHLKYRVMRRKIIGPGQGTILLWTYAIGLKVRVLEMILEMAYRGHIEIGLPIELTNEPKCLTAHDFPTCRAPLMSGGFLSDSCFHSSRYLLMILFKYLMIIPSVIYFLQIYNKYLIIKHV